MLLVAVIRSVPLHLLMLSWGNKNSYLVFIGGSFCRFRLWAKQWPATQACHKLTSQSVVSFDHLALTHQDLQCNWWRKALVKSLWSDWRYFTITHKTCSVTDEGRPWWSLCEVTEGTSPSHIKTCSVTDEGRPWWSLCEVTEGTSPSHIKTCSVTDEGRPWWSLSEVTLRVLCRAASCCTRKSVRFLLKMNSV